MLTDAQKNALLTCVDCGNLLESHWLTGGTSKWFTCRSGTQCRGFNTTEAAVAALIASEVQQATTYLAKTWIADAQAELATARATNSRLNRRLQIAESALNELNGNGQGAPNKIHREAWTRHQEQLRETRVKLNKIGALAEAWEHTDHDADEREPDCAGCWSASIWAILGDES
jgi:hypothetical protein